MSRRAAKLTPKPHEIQAAQKASGLDDKACADLLYTSVGKWVDWRSGYVRMHPAFWQLFRIKTGQLQPDAETNNNETR